MTIVNQQKQRNELVTVALDIGTAYSGYTYLSRSNFDINPLNVKCENWHVGELGTVPKDKSIILLDNAKKCIAFGCEAEEMYHEMKTDQAKQHY